VFDRWQTWWNTLLARRARNSDVAYLRKKVAALSVMTDIRPLTEGCVVKGGQNVFPSQVQERPAPPGAINQKENNGSSSQTVSRETRRVNRTGKCLECEAKLKRRTTGRFPLYCMSCRGERSRQQNRKAVARYRAKKARAA